MNTHKPCILNIAGKSSNDIYLVSVPSNLLGFCKFDFTRFTEDCNQLCRDCMKTGEYPVDEVNLLRNSISKCHRYYENNMRGIFDKIVVDCWIDYICRQSEMSVSTLWNSFIDCKTPFEKVIFQRLSEYRAHRAINRWEDILRVQEYAKKKIDYVFGCKLNNLNEAIGRLNVFDLMFSVAANEQGYSLDSVSSVKVYRPGRLSASPFVFSGAAKEIIRNLFKDVHFAESQDYVANEEGAVADREAMDAFGVIKSYLPEHSDNVVNTIIKSMVKVPDKVYVPSGFKAMIDLEIDTIINSGSFLQRCRRCGEFYIRNDSYTSEYCDTVHRDGSTCREIMEQPKFDPPTPEELELLKEKSDGLYKEISERVGKNITQRDFSEWLGYFNVIKSKVFNGEARTSDFDDFVDYTNQFSFPPPTEQTQAEPPQNEESEETSPDGKKIKPYQFTRIDRRQLEQSGALKPIEKIREEEPVPDADKKSSVIPPQPVVAKIIRGADPSVYREIPARPISIGNGDGENSFKSDIYLGEDFSLGEGAASTGESTSEAIRSIAESGLQDTSKHEAKSKTKEETHFLPDLDQFEDPSDHDREQELLSNSSKFAPPDFSSPSVSSDSGAAVETQSLFAAEEKRTSVDDSSRNAPQIKRISDLAKDNEKEDSLNDEPRHENRSTLNGEKYPTPDNSAYSRYSANSAYSDVKLNATAAVLDKLSEFNREEEKTKSRFEESEDLSGNQPKEYARSRKKSPEISRAAKVVSAYKTVNDMPERQSAPSDSSLGGESGGKASDEFAKILDSIERNDGFEEENLPLDPDGVPLSHKTKHVMDAIMKNTGVSPSLIYGRRQAAEKNVVLDDSFGETKK